MAPVPTESPRFCVDKWEGTVVSGVATSQPGALPTTGLTFDGAVAACAAAEVRDGAGAVVGHKRMPLASEWEDAADGLLGPGGAALPYGGGWRSGACNVPDRGGEPGHRALAPTGSHPACVTPGGAFDLLGNAWEWTDSGLRVDIAGWFARRRAEGLDLERTPDDRLRPRAGGVEALAVVLNAVRPDALRVADDGLLVLAAGAAAPNLFPSGFLTLARATEAAPYLPITVAPADPAAPAGAWAVRVKAADDGAPLPDKRGCASYAGSSTTCDASAAALAHPHDFDGSIAVRCVADPIPP